MWKAFFEVQYEYHATLAVGGSLSTVTGARSCWCCFWVMDGHGVSLPPIWKLLIMRMMNVVNGQSLRLAVQKLKVKLKKISLKS